MKNVAIVGVEGSGKTVMLACLGDLYSTPDDKGYFLCPANMGTFSYVTDIIGRMRQGEWPTATEAGALQGLDWTLRRKSANGKPPVDICKISFLDFGGEVYRAAFGAGESSADLADEVTALKEYISTADDIVVLINLSDVIANGVGNKRVQESMWITNQILSTALAPRDDGEVPRASIAITQADNYANEIRACGGAKGVLTKYLRHVANSYDWLPVFGVNAVDRTVLDAEGFTIPAPNFTSRGLLPLMDWVKMSVCQETVASKTEKPANYFVKLARGFVKFLKILFVKFLKILLVIIAAIVLAIIITALMSL